MTRGPFDLRPTRGSARIFKGTLLGTHYVDGNRVAVFRVR